MARPATTRLGALFHQPSAVITTYMATMEATAEFLRSDAREAWTEHTMEIATDVVTDQGDSRAVPGTSFEFDSSTSGSLEHGVSTTPDPLQETYDDISSGKNLVGKIAGNDAVGEIADEALDTPHSPRARGVLQTR